MSYIAAAEDEEYLEALAATKFLGIPVEGLKRIDDSLTSSKSVITALKQNNSIIYLLIKVLKKVEKLETEVAILKESFIKASKENPQFQESLEKLIQEVSKVKIAEKGKEIPPSVIRKSYFFKNPKEIFNIEKSKLRKDEQKKDVI